MSWWCRDRIFVARTVAVRHYPILNVLTFDVIFIARTVLMGRDFTLCDDSSVARTVVIGYCPTLNVLSFDLIPVARTVALGIKKILKIKNKIK